MLQRRDFVKLKPGRTAPSEGYWLHVHRSAMACRFEVTLPLWEERGILLARHALDEVDRIEQQLSIFSEKSEVSLVNRNAAVGPCALTPPLYTLLLLSQELSAETAGAFDITSGPLSRCWGFLKREGRVPSPEEIKQARVLVGADKLLIDQEAGTIRFARPGVEINFGSIGKGYALERMAALMHHRIHAALLSAGASSIRAIGGGDRGQNGWLVGVRHPLFKERRLATLRMRDVAMSTSGSEEQFFEVEGRRYGHIIDPRSGMPADLVSSVTVVARSAALSDALSTAFYVGGPELAQSYCARHPETLVIMLENGRERPTILGANKKCEVELIND